MRILMLIMMLATVLPMVALLAWIWPALKKRWQGAGRGAQAAVCLAWLAGAVALWAFPHEDVFAGLDVIAYRKMANVFLEGRGFHDRDIVLEEVPKEIRRYVYFQPGPLGRPTRDLLFQLSNWQGVETEPFFLPTLPLAAGGLSPVQSPDRFVPLMGAFGLALVLAAGFYAGGGWGVLACLVLVMGTAWPAWFLRGFYAEGVGAILVAAVVAASAVRPLRGGMILVAGLALGLSVSYHPTLVILALPVGLGLLAERGHWGETGRWAVGAVLGILPLLAMTKWVCQPYANFLSLEQLRWLMCVSPEHRAVAMGLTILAFGGAGLLAVCHSGRVRVRFGTGWQRLVLTIGLVAVCLVALCIPFFFGGILLKGWTAVWSGIGWGFAGLVTAGCVFVFAMYRPMRERFWLAAICAAAMFFLYLKGLEIPVGLWSQRRFLPVILVGIALLAAPLSAGLSVCIVRWRSARLVWVMLLIVPGLWNVVHWPTAYFTVNERGATEWTRSVAERIGTNRWVIFDYYPHSVPYAAGLKQKVLGLGASSRDHWPEVADWITSIATSSEVWVATSWTPCTLEDGVRLEEVFVKSGSFPGIKTKGYFPVEQGSRVVENHFMALVPLSDGKAGMQYKVLDGSPIGLRGSWGRSDIGLNGPDGAPLAAQWTRASSSVIGPVPKPGGQVRIVMEASAGRLDGRAAQVIQVIPPWGGEGVELTFSNNYTLAEGLLVRQADQNDYEKLTGEYRLVPLWPYNPGEVGIRGFHGDLGVLLHRIRIEAEPVASGK